MSKVILIQILEEVCLVGMGMTSVKGVKIMICCSLSQKKKGGKKMHLATLGWQ